VRYYIIAGEASGDLYGGMLMRDLKKKDPKAEFRFWGGIIFIDYPGFNLRMCKWAKNEGYQTAYYISPQLWAWKENRHKILRDHVDLFFVILPFERDFYRNLDTPCFYVGHPLKEIIKNEERKIPETIKTIGLFPGSRKQEIQQHLSTMLEFALMKKDYKFIIAGVSHIDKKYYLSQIKQYAAHIDIIYDSSYEVMKKIDFAIASSGTATLELALFNVPQIVIYKTSQLSFAIAKRLVKTDYISLVNLVAQKEVVPELLQAAFNSLALEVEFNRLKSLEERMIIQNEYDRMRNDLGAGNSTELVASHILDFLSPT